MTVQNRVTYIDIAKAIGIYLVILGHVVDSGTPIKTFLYSFHMPLFFVLTGMTYKWPLDNSWATIKERLTRYAGVLLVPYVIFALFYSKLTFHNLAYISYASWHTLKMAGSLSSLWFLMALFMSHVYLLFLIKYLPRKFKTKSLSLFILAILSFIVGVLLPYGRKYGYPWMTNVAFVGVSFILLGMFLRKVGEYFINMKLAWRVLLLFLTLFLFLVLFPINNPSPGYVLMADALYGNVILFPITAVLGCVLVIMISQVLDLSLSSHTILLWIGQNTLGIFLIHKFIVSEVRSLFMHINVDYNGVFIATLSSVLVLIISSVLVMIINLFFPELLHYRKK